MQIWSTTNTQNSHNWCRIYTGPYDILSLLIIYTKYSKVYSTQSTPNNEDHGFKEIEFLSDKDISKIAVGGDYAIYLGSDGIIYGSGVNGVGELGTGDKKDVVIPAENKYFVDNNIKIVDVATGFGHSLWLIVMQIYSWGYNQLGQCGQDWMWW